MKEAEEEREQRAKREERERSVTRICEKIKKNKISGSAAIF